MKKDLKKKDIVYGPTLSGLIAFLFMIFILGLLIKGIAWSWAWLF